MRYISCLAVIMLLPAGVVYAASPDDINCAGQPPLGSMSLLVAGSAGVRVNTSGITGAIVSGDTLFPIGNGIVKFPIELQNEYPNSFNLAIGLAVYSPDGAHWAHATANGGNMKALPATMFGIWVDTTGAAGGGVGKDQFGALYKFNLWGADGAGEDSLTFSGAANDAAQTAWPPNFTGVFFKILLNLSSADAGKHICIDSGSNAPPTCFTWRWPSHNYTPAYNAFPTWNGPYCYVLGGCCRGLTGNYDCSPDDNVDIADISAAIDRYTTFAMPCCPGEANVDGSPDGVADISDLSRLIGYLYVTFELPAPCQ